MCLLEIRYTLPLYFIPTKCFLSKHDLCLGRKVRATSFSMLWFNLKSGEGTIPVILANWDKCLKFCELRGEVYSQD